MEEGLLPHIRSFDDLSQMEEERRLCYVGITRAKERLYLTRAFRRNFLGASRPNPPSRFLGDIPLHLVEPTALQAGDRDMAAPASSVPVVSFHPPEGENTFKAGDHIRHSKFGEGIVISCLAVRDDYEITAAFKGQAGVKKLLLSFAPLEKIG